MSILSNATSHAHREIPPDPFDFFLSLDAERQRQLVREFADAELADLLAEAADVRASGAPWADAAGQYTNVGFILATKWAAFLAGRMKGGRL